MLILSFVASDPAIHGGAEIINRGVRVDHRGSNISMTHQRLGFMKRHASTKEVRAKEVAKGMGGFPVQAVPLQQHSHFLRHLVARVGLPVLVRNN
jgi:hypothetical protein